jgi:hypothetical protein
MMTRPRSLLCSLILGITALSAGTGSASASVPVFHKCGTFTGATWTVAAFNKKGTKWSVTASGTPCAFAKTWAQKLEKTPNHGEAGTKLVGPTGWSCLPSIAESRGTPGSCTWPGNRSPTTQASKQFGWGPAAS